MYLRARDIYCVSLLRFFLLDLGTVLTVWYFWNFVLFVPFPIIRTVLWVI
jgi:hypothetical protein